MVELAALRATLTINFPNSRGPAWSCGTCEHARYGESPQPKEGERNKVGKVAEWSAERD